MTAVKSIQELLDESPATDNTTTLGRLWGVMGELRAKLLARFELHPNPDTEDLRAYGTADGRFRGEMFTFRGPVIDYLVSSWIGNPALGFTNLHLNIWLKPHLRVPHLGIVFGTIPDLFFYADYVPRTDLWVDLDYLDRYYEPLNPGYLELRGDARLKPFVSLSTYIRQAQSPAALAYTAPVNDDTISLVTAAAHERLDRWLDWMEQPEVTPEADRAAMAQRDLAIRRATGQRDPANAIGVRAFGAEYAGRLLAGLWGVRLDG